MTRSTSGPRPTPAGRCRRRRRATASRRPTRRTTPSAKRDGTAAVLELIDAGLPGMVGPQTEALTEEAVRPMHAVATAEDVEAWYAENGVRVPMFTSDG